MKADPARANAIGNDVHVSGVAWCRGLGTPETAWRGVMRGRGNLRGGVHGAGGKRSPAWAELEESYFMYMEDIDLSLRLRSLGRHLSGRV